MTKVALFVTCIIDTIFPRTGEATLDILEKLGVQVDFPASQTCCGQPAFNSGFQADARDVARGFLRAFDGYDHIVTPSGSCAAMVRHYYTELFKNDPQREQAERIAARTYELTEYLVDVLKVDNLGTSLARPTRAVLHDACHGLRGLGIKQQPRALLQHVGNLTLNTLAGHEQCCGFGGLFAVKMSDISGAMLKDKLVNIAAAEADIVITGDSSCLMHINGGLSRAGSKRRVVHVAEVLAGKI